jgi:L-fuconolactonase
VKPQPAPKKVSFYRPILELAYDAFGEDRLVYGSDWPVTETTGDYQSVLKLTRAWARTKGDSFELKLFYKNAVRFYGIPKILRETIPSTIPKK